MPTYLQLIDSQPGSLSGAGTALTTAGESLDGVTRSFSTTVQRTNGMWMGDAQQAQTKAADRLRMQIGGICANFQEVASAVAAAGAELTAVVASLRAAVAAAESVGFEVIPAVTAVVVPGPAQLEEAAAAGPGAPAVLAAFEAAAEAQTMMLASMVEAATAIDEAVAASIEGISAQLDAAAAGLIRPPAVDPAFSDGLQPGQWNLDNALRFDDRTTRGTGGEAYLTSGMLREGKKPPVPEEIVPAGYLGADGPHAKSHVIADVLGGPLEDARNYATLYSKAFSRTNDGPMAKLEKRIKAVVGGKADGIPQQNVRYRVDMVGDDKLPDGVRIHAVGDRGYRESIYLPNL